MACSLVLVFEDLTLTKKSFPPGLFRVLLLTIFPLVDLFSLIRKSLLEKTPSFLQKFIFLFCGFLAILNTLSSGVWRPDLFWFLCRLGKSFFEFKLLKFYFFVLIMLLKF